MLLGGAWAAFAAVEARAHPWQLGNTADARVLGAIYKQQNTLLLQLRA